MNEYDDYIVDKFLDGEDPDDIAEREDVDISIIRNIINNSKRVLYPRWTKNINISKEISIDDFVLRPFFKHVANVHRVEYSGKGRPKQTVIEFIPTCTATEWSRKTEWIYIFTIEGKIVKIGGTRTGLKGRTGSYLCGHFIKERGKSGATCSTTNAFIYNTFDHNLRNGNKIDMYGYEIPTFEVKLPIWGVEKTINPQTYTAFETGALEAYKKAAKHYPQLSDNSDPTHR